MNVMKIVQDNQIHVIAAIYRYTVRHGWRSIRAGPVAAQVLVLRVPLLRGVIWMPTSIFVGRFKAEGYSMKG